MMTHSSSVLSSSAQHNNASADTKEVVEGPDSKLRSDHKFQEFFEISHSANGRPMVDLVPLTNPLFLSGGISGPIRINIIEISSGCSVRSEPVRKINKPSAQLSTIV